MSARSSKTAALTLPLFACLAVVLFTSSDTAPSATPVAGAYIGAAKCKNCHGSADTGNQYAAWSKTLHAHAFETLASDKVEVKEAAAKRNVTEPAKDAACVKCHVTGFGEPAEKFARGWKPELGVQCETCHGPGDDHLKVRMKAAASADPKAGYQPLPEGEMVTSPGVDVCVKCHNPESPSYKPFCYFEYRAKLSHMNPKKPRTEEEQADYGKCACGTPCPHAEGCPERKCNLKPDELAALKK